MRTRVPALLLLAAVSGLLLLAGPATAAPAISFSNATTAGFTVKWTPVSGAQSYAVWVEPVAKTSGGLSATTTSWSFTGAAAGTTYTVKLDVLVAGTWKTMATTSVTTATAAPAAIAPTLSTSNVTSAGFTVGWAPVSGAQSYAVWVEPVSKTSGGLSASTTSWPFTGASASTTYTVKLDVLVAGIWATKATTRVTTAAGTMPTPPPPIGTSWVLADPVAPITTISNPSGLGLNVNNVVGGSYHDYVIDGGGDSSILLQGTTTSTTLSRIHITRTNAYPTVSWAAHGIYDKARGNSFFDIYADDAGGHGVSGFSVRMGNNLFERTVVKGYAHAVSYYEHDGATGTVTFRNGTWAFTGDTAVWGDDSNEPPTPYIKQAFVFENINATGPAGAYFLKFGNSAYASGLAYRGAGVLIKNCTINGQPVSAAKVSGVPSNLLTIQ